MTVELIPVIEIGYCNQGIPVPDKYACWDHPTAWNIYKQESYTKAGFTGELRPYLAGSFFIGSQTYQK